MKSHNKPNEHKHHKKSPMVSIFINNPVHQEVKVENKHEERKDEGCASCFDWLKKRF